MTLPDWVLLITLPLGVARAMFFVMNDVIIERPRNWVKGRSHKVEQLLDCPWCTGLWLSIGACAALAWDYVRPLTKWALLAFSVSLVIALLDHVIDRTPVLADDADEAAAEAARRAEPPAKVRAAIDQAR